jgi:hypothetical protein
VIWALGAVAIVAALFGYGLRTAGVNRVLVPLLACCLCVTATYLILGRPTAVPWYCFLGSVFGGIGVGVVIAQMWSTRALKGRAADAVRVGQARVLMDFRVAAVLAGLLLSYVLTFYFARLATHENPPVFWMGFYQSWVSGLLFFTVVGLVVGLVTLYRPEKDVFAARVKILVGGKSGSAVDYIAGELRRIGYVAQRTDRIITIEEYDAARRAFKLRVKQRSIVRNIYHDVATEATGGIKVTPDAFNPPLIDTGQLVSFRVNKINQPGVPAPFGQHGLSRDWTVSIPAGGAGEIEYEHWMWYSEAEVHEFAPVRFTETLTVEFNCRCTLNSGRLRLSVVRPGNDVQMLDWDVTHRLGSLHDLEPVKTAYQFQLGIGN